MWEMLFLPGTVGKYREWGKETIRQSEKVRDSLDQEFEDDNTCITLPSDLNRLKDLFLNLPEISLKICRSEF